MARINRSASAVGMMEGAFFVSRSDLLQWVNDMLCINLTKVEQCASGAVYCQIIDSCHPGTVPMRKVNWMGKSDHEFIPNYKVLQSAFDKNGIDRHIAVDMLIRQKYQDNLEFLQFMKCYWERVDCKPVYDPVGARHGSQLPPWAKGVDSRGVGRGGAPIGVAELRKDASGYPAVREKAQENSTVNRGGATAQGAKPRPSPQQRAAAPAAPAPAPAKPLEDLRGQLALQVERNEELTATLDGLEKERDYYYHKLRDVEILCTTLQAQADPEMTVDKLLSTVTSILYAEEATDQ